MSNPQFAHIETYARSRSALGSKKVSAVKEAAKSKGGASSARERLTIDQVLAEAERQPDACPHVDSPKPPIVHRGGVAELRTAIEHMAAEAKAMTGRALRKDQRILMAPVASHPARPEDLADPEVARVVGEWCDRNVQFWDRWAQERGGTLHTVLEHGDESHVHLHFYILPGEEVRWRADAMHPGKIAKEATAARLKAEGVTPAEAERAGNRAYRQAMRGFQDAYQSAVGEWCGLTRDGPKRGRRTRAEESALQKALHATAIAERAADSAQALAAVALEERDQLREERDAARAEAERVRTRSNARVEELRQHLVGVVETTQVAAAEVDRREAELVQREAILADRTSEIGAREQATDAERTRLQRVEGKLREIWNQVTRREEAVAERERVAERRAAAVTRREAALETARQAIHQPLKALRDRLVPWLERIPGAPFRDVGLVVVRQVDAVLAGRSVEREVQVATIEQNWRAHEEARQQERHRQEVRRRPELEEELEPEPVAPRFG